MSSSYRKKLERLGDYYGVTRGNKSDREWSDAIKKEAGKPYGNVDEMLRELDSREGDKSSKAKIIDAEVVKDEKGSTLPATINVRSPDQTVEVAGTTLHFTLSPASVNVDMSEPTLWLNELKQAALYLMIFCSGTMLGLLVAGKVLGQ